MIKKNFILWCAVIFQILLLVNMPISHSYKIFQSENLIEKRIDTGKNFEEILEKGLNLLVGILSIDQIGIVSADCCLDTCQDFEEENECDGNSVPTDCELTSHCELGTCVDDDEATCSAGAPHGSCDGDGLTWHSEGINDVNECQLGCCTYNGGASKEYFRKIECIKEEGSFDASVKKSECKIYTQEMGACLLGEDNCRFVTEEDCATNLHGDFRFGVLCSNPNLETVCEIPLSRSETRTTCYNDRVYFMDSCNNLANIYDASLWDDENYWSFVRNASFGCLQGNNYNIGSDTCGFCDGANSVCAPASEANANPRYGNNACKSLTCIDENGIKRQNQESWCVYESFLGDGKDVVGSEHRLRWCDRGEIKTELCGNFRGKICGEREIDLGNGETFSIARCRFNEGWKCLGVEIEYKFSESGTILNKDEIEEDRNECRNISDCIVTSIDRYDKESDDYVKFDVCTPKYPPGLEFWEQDSNAEDICKIANVKIPTVWTKGVLTDWACKGNCQILTQRFAGQMNEFCISLGDCGAYVNVEGKYTKNIETFDIDELDEDKYEIKSKYTADGDIHQDRKNEYRSYAEDAQMGEGEAPKFLSSTEEGNLGGDPFEDFEVIDWDIISDNMDEIVGSGFLGLVGSLFLSSMGWTFGIPGGWLFLLLTGIFLVLFGDWEKKEVDIEFVCEPWEAPTGGDDCDECNNDPLRPCTEYKCRSLGSGCRLIDEDELYESENPVCVYEYDGDKIPPQIEFGEIDEDIYSTEEETNNGVTIILDDGSSDECIQEFTQLNFTLLTKDEDGEDDYAKCVYNWRRVDLEAPDYELEGESFEEGGFFSVEHSFNERLPFVSDLDSADITGSVQGERTGDVNMYVRCIDYAGNPNFNEYVVNLCIREGPDTTPAQIEEYVPEDESYLPYGETTSDLTILLNEPADCKWSHEADKNYDEMTGEFNSCVDFGTTGRCSGEIDGLTASENKIYIKCKDQPQISEEGYDGPWTEENRNVNVNDFVYTLQATPSELMISSVSLKIQSSSYNLHNLETPLEIITGGTVNGGTLEVKTSGGMANGVAKCKYDFIEPDWSWDFFAQTGSITHSQTWDLESVNYNILIECEDAVGNPAQANAKFNMLIDEDEPIVVRAFKEGSNLKLITNEDAKCYYSFDNCYFDLESGTSMTTAFSREHETKWNEGVTYYIKCKDIFENENSDCAIQIIPTT